MHAHSHRQDGFSHLGTWPPRSSNSRTHTHIENERRDPTPTVHTLDPGHPRASRFIPRTIRALEREGQMHPTVHTSRTRGNRGALPRWFWWCSVRHALAGTRAHVWADPWSGPCPGRAGRRRTPPPAHAPSLPAAAASQRDGAVALRPRRPVSLHGDDAVLPMEVRVGRGRRSR